MLEVLDDVRQFIRASLSTYYTKPQLLPWDLEESRMALIHEEHHELTVAVANGNMVEIADAIADLIYVVVFLAVTMGIPLEHVWREVHATNMAKAGPDGHFKQNEAGKIMKPAGWTPPDIRRILIDAGWTPPPESEDA